MTKRTAEKTTTKSSSTKTTTTKSKPTTTPMKKKVTTNKPTISALARMQKIQERAYYIAEKKGFAPGHDHENWLQAEAEIDRELSDYLIQ